MLSASVPTAPSSPSRGFGVAGVPTGLGEHVDQDVEQFHLGARPPRHVARGIDGEGFDRRVAVVRTRRYRSMMLLRDSCSVAHMSARRSASTSSGARVPERDGRRPRRSTWLPGRQVLDQAQEVGPSRGQRAAGVVLVRARRPWRASPRGYVPGHRADMPSRSHRSWDRTLPLAPGGINRLFVEMAPPPAPTASGGVVCQLPVLITSVRHRSDGSTVRGRRSTSRG